MVRLAHLFKRPFRLSASFDKRVLLSMGLLAGSAGSASATDYNVSSAIDFENALVSIRSTPSQDDRIFLQGDVSLSGPVESILKSTSFTLIINGNGHTIDGHNSFRPFFINQGNLVINNLNIKDGMAKGGDGGAGGMGAGGAIYVGSSAAVRLSQVTFQDNSAVGGNGSTVPMAGGGGLGGDGGLSSPNFSGGGGLYGVGGNASGTGGGGGGGELGGGGGATSSGGGGGGGIIITAVTSTSSIGTSGGGIQGGDGGNNGASGHDANGVGGGGGGGGNLSTTGGNGGLFGGGGGGYSSGGNGGDYGGGGGSAVAAGNGGFGGGGGNGDTGGNGGFGGGGGKGTGSLNGGVAGYGGGAAGYGAGGGGGGGAGYGGAIFVRQGGIVIIDDGVSFSGNSATGGLGGGSGAGQGGNGASDGQTTFFMLGTELAVDITQPLVLSNIGGNADGTSNAGVTLDKEGTGTLILEGASQYVGTATIHQGTIQFDGHYEGNVLVQSGASVSGSGTIDGLTLYGLVSPGSPSLALSAAPQADIGVLTINGNYDQQAGATYQVDIAPDGTSDRINVSGSANLTGGTLQVQAQGSGFTLGTKYTILTASSGLTGEFSSVNGTVIDGLTFDLLYSANSILLELVADTPNLIADAITTNQFAVATTLDNLVQNQAADSDLLHVIDSLANLPSSGAIQDGLNQLSGEIHGSTNTIQLQNSTFQLRTISNHMVGLLSSGSPTSGTSFGPTMVQQSARLNPAAPPSGIRQVSHEETDDAPTMSTEELVNYYCCHEEMEPDWTGWNVGFGQGTNVASNGNAGAVDATMGGLLFGMDRWVSDNTVIGVFGGYSRTSLTGSIADSYTSINGYQVGLETLHKLGNLYGVGVFGYAHDDYDSSRLLNFGNVLRSANGHYHANQFMKYAEFGYSMTKGSLLIQPFIATQFVLLHQGAFTEFGAGSAGLNVDDRTVNSLRSALGSRAATVIDCKGIPVTITGQARWMHEYLDATQLISAQFIGGPTSSFRAAGANIGRDYGIFGLGAAVPLKSWIYVYGEYDLQVASRYDAHTGSGGLVIQW